MNRYIPLLAYGLALLSAVYLTPGCADSPWYQAEFHRLSMRSGDSWSLTPRDTLFVGMVFLLLFDLATTSVNRGRSLPKHALSVVVLVLSVVMLIDCPGCGNSSFVMFSALAFFDLFAGIIITRAVSHRDRAYRPAHDDD